MPYWFLGQKVKGQGFGTLYIENGFWTITDSNPPMIMKLHTLTPHESRMCPIDFRVKRSRSWGIDDWKWFPDHVTSYTYSLWVSDVPSWLWGEKVKDHGVNWKWFPDDNWLCNPPMIMKLHTFAPHESRTCPIDFGVKRSKVKVIWHWWLKIVSGQ